jgi:hypothetical protein
VGVNNIAWECDYPHSDSTWPKSPETLIDACAKADVADAEINKITHENAINWYGYDPFVNVARSDASVGSLRARATDVDVGVRSRADFRQQFEQAS